MIHTVLERGLERFLLFLHKDSHYFLSEKCLDSVVFVSDFVNDLQDVHSHLLPRIIQDLI